MPPRKRRRGGSTSRTVSVAPSSPRSRADTSPPPASTTSATTSPRTPVPRTQRRSRRSLPAETDTSSPYRTRHRRAVRGPEIAVKEGALGDLVPPSDDEEYDAWKAVAAVRRIEGDVEMNAEAGPSRPRRDTLPRRPEVTFASTPQVFSFQPLFDDSEASSGIESEYEHESYRDRLSTEEEQRDRDAETVVVIRSPKGKVYRGDMIMSDSLDDAPESVTTARPRTNAQKRPFISGLEGVADEAYADPPGTPPDGPDPPTSPHRAKAAPALARVSPASQRTPPPNPSLLGSSDDQLRIPPTSPVRFHISVNRPLPTAPPGLGTQNGRPSSSLPPPSQSSSRPSQQSDHPPSQEMEVEESQIVRPTIPTRTQDAGPLQAMPKPDLGYADVPPDGDVEMQPDFENHHDFAMEFDAAPARSPSPARSFRDESPDPLDFLAALSPDSPRAASQRPTQRPLRISTVPSQHVPPSPPSTRPSQRISQRATSPQRTPAHRSSPPVADPALLQFRFSRTFRTRTALQLQPYTREKQLYVKALQRGGLAKGKRAIAPAADVAANSDTDTSDSANQSSGSDDDATPPDAIVIGATQEQAPQTKKREPKPLVDADYDEYFLRFGALPDEEDDESVAKLQTIARDRLRLAKEERRAAKAAELVRRGFESIFGAKDKEAARLEREKEKEERERHRQQREKDKEERGMARIEQEAKTKEREARLREKEQRRRERQKIHSTASAPNGNGKSPRLKTYARRHQRPINQSDSSDLSEAPPSDGGELPAHQGERSKDPSGEAGIPPISRSQSLGHDIGHDFYEAPGFDDYDGGMFDIPVELLQEPPNGESLPVGPRRTQGLKTRRVPRSSDASDNSQSFFESDMETSAPAVRDKRERIARRMLPGVMLKRLEAAEKEREKRMMQEAKERRRADRGSVSPVRPGRAVVRRGAGGAPIDMDGIFSDESSQERQQSEQRTPRERETKRPRREERPREKHRREHHRERTPRRLDPDDELESMLGSVNDPIPVDFDLEASEDNSDASSAGPIAIMSDSGSEAMEDNQDETLAYLHRGDFEAILRGRSAAAVIRPLDHKQQNDREQRRKRKPARPALRRVSDAGDGLVQARLKLPTLHKRTSVWDTGAVPERGPIGAARRTGGQRMLKEWDTNSEPRAHADRRDRNKVSERQGDKPNEAWNAKIDKAASRRSRDSERARTRTGPRRRRGPRPAIRLDDQTIFATEEFAFESDHELEPVRDAPPAKPALGKRAFTRVTSRPDRRSPGVSTPTSPATPGRGPAPENQIPRKVDDGVGKARSWANFDRFPIDFDIVPLPSGVHLAGNEIVTNLSPFLASLSGAEEVDVKPLRAFGVDLHPAMDLQETLAILPIVLDGIRAAISAYVDDPSHREPDAVEKVTPLATALSPLSFLRDLLAKADPAFQSAVYPLVQSFTDRLGDISLTSRSEDRAATEQLVLVRYALLQIATAVSPSHVPAAATSLFKLLLIYGFDRTLRPIRKVLRGEVDTPEIIDRTVAVWVAAGHILASHDRTHDGDTFGIALLEALDDRYAGEIGPLAAERVWFLIFGLCALAQFEIDGAVAAGYTPYPRWGLVKRAINLIKVTHSQEAEESAHLDQLQGRDRYIKTMVARCLRLSSAWQWSFDRSSFSVATRDLGMIFKERQHRNLPTEPPVDFPPFISEYDISLTAADDSPDTTRRASAFELYLRLASVAASDVIASAEVLTEAHQAERDVQRLIMSIFPLSAVPFTRAKPPTARQLAALINRYSTMVVACYFSPALLPWLLSNSAKWINFQDAGFESRQVVIRGLMYLAVACRHHSHPLDTVVGRLAEVLETLQSELETLTRSKSPAPFHPTKVEIERTMVLVVTAFRQIILHQGYAPSAKPVYPDPSLLHQSWVGRVFQLDLAKDVKSGLEIVSTIQAFLDARAAALPQKAVAARRSAHESLDDYPSLGFDFDAVDLAALGGDEAQVVKSDPIEEADAAFAQIILDTICPKIYRLLSDMLPPVLDETAELQAQTDRNILVNKLTKCWSDCAGIVVVEHRLKDWSMYVGAFGQQSWSRLGNEEGRIQVGLHFMLNVGELDPAAFKTHEEEFLALFFQALVCDRLTIQHKYISAVSRLPGALDHALLEGMRDVLSEFGSTEATDFDISRSTFLENRPKLLEAVFGNISPLLQSRFTPAETKSLVYRCVNLLVSAMAGYEGAIDPRRVLHRESYRAFVADTVRALRRLAGEYVTPMAVPALKALSYVK